MLLRTVCYWTFLMHQKFNRPTSTSCIRRKHTKQTQLNGVFSFYIFFLCSPTYTSTFNSYLINFHTFQIYTSRTPYLIVCAFDQHHYKHDVEQTMQWSECVCVLFIINIEVNWSSYSMLSEIKVRMYLWVSVCLYYPSKQKHPSDMYVPGKEEAKKGLDNLRTLAI